MKINIFIVTAIIAFNNCKKEEPVEASEKILFSEPQKVTILNYTDHAMEPFISRDGRFLFFNNLNQPGTNTNLFYASKVNDSVFNFIGEIPGINSIKLDGVPSVDANNTLYFISLRSWEQNPLSIFQSDILNGNSTVDFVPGVEQNANGWVNFDAAISHDGNLIFISKGSYDYEGGPYEADIFVYQKVNGKFSETDNKVLQNINSKNTLEYAACVSSDLLELYFTRTASLPQIFAATRKTTEEPFSQPYKIEVIEGFAEAPALSPDNKILYYHKNENGRFVIYMVRKE